MAGIIHTLTGLFTKKAVGKKSSADRILHNLCILDDANCSLFIDTSNGESLEFKIDTIDIKNKRLWLKIKKGSCDLIPLSKQTILSADYKNLRAGFTVIPDAYNTDMCITSFPSDIFINNRRESNRYLVDDLVEFSVKNIASTGIKGCLIDISHGGLRAGFDINEKDIKLERNYIYNDCCIKLPEGVLSLRMILRRYFFENNGNSLILCGENIIKDKLSRQLMTEYLSSLQAKEVEKKKLMQHASMSVNSAS